jgi:asparagine synthase (glutamine-hydrolysing)
MLAPERRFFVADHYLTYTDKMSMTVRVEVRVPFLDTDLVEQAARIPAKLKPRGRLEIGFRCRAYLNQSGATAAH